jgi:hypothetical protein
MLDLMIKLYLLKSCVQFKIRIFFGADLFVWRNRLWSRRETEAQVGKSGRQLLYRRTINNLANTVGACEVLNKKVNRLSHPKKDRRVSPSTLLLHHQFLLLL